MARLGAIGTAAALVVTAVVAGEAPLEADMARVLCSGMILERVLPNRARVDCLTDEYAIEVDWTGKWAEAIGQALYYSWATGRKPGIILVCKEAQQTCLGHALRLDEAIAGWALPITVWRCELSARTLTDCRRVDR
jgi:hypothetical protein